MKYETAKRSFFNCLTDFKISYAKVCEVDPVFKLTKDVPLFGISNSELTYFFSSERGLVNLYKFPLIGPPTINFVVTLDSESNSESVGLIKRIIIDPKLDVDPKLDAGNFIINLFIGAWPNFTFFTNILGSMVCKILNLEGLINRLLVEVTDTKLILKNLVLSDLSRVEVEVAGTKLILKNLVLSEKFLSRNAFSLFLESRSGKSLDYIDSGDELKKALMGANLNDFNKTYLLETKPYTNCNSYSVSGSLPIVKRRGGTMYSSLETTDVEWDIIVTCCNILSEFDQLFVSGLVFI